MDPAASELDPEIQTFRERIAAGYAMHPSLDSVPLEEARRICEDVRAPFAQGGPTMASTSLLRLPQGDGSVRVRIHLPHDSPSPQAALVYLHGGGWRYFSIDTHDRLMREYAARAGIAVVGIDYALAPEAPYPAALQQSIATLAWLEREGASMGIDPRRLALGGDSAGANLALATALHLNASGPSPLRGLVLNYGTFRRDVASASHQRYAGPSYSLTSDEMVGFWRDYLGSASTGSEGMLAEPLRASLDALRGLPPCFLAIAECDVLRDDSVEMADRLAHAGVGVTSMLYPGTTHSFLEAMSISAVSRRALDETAAWLQRQLGCTSDGTPP